MRVWKLQASDSDDWLPSFWGYALAHTSEEAMRLGLGDSSKRLIRVYEKHPAMIWPGAPSARIEWTSLVQSVSLGRWKK